MPDVFISYARGDRKRVRPIAKALAAEGFDVWWDQSSSQDGAWTPQLRRALVDSAAILACWSQEATKSSWVAAEATHANDRKALVGAILEACKIPAPFNAVESADLMKWRGDQDAPAWRNIVRQLRQLVRVRDGDTEEPEEDQAPPQAQRAPAPPAQQAAQVVAPTAFFSQSLGRPQQAQARAAQPQSPQRAFQPVDAPPPPPKPPPRVVLPPMDPPPPTPRPRTIEQRRSPQPFKEPTPPQAFAPEKLSPVRPIDEPADKRRPARPAEESRPRAAPPPPPRSFQPIDEPAPRQSRQSDRDRRSAPPPPRPYTPVDEAPPRRKGGFAQFVLMGAVAAVIVVGVVWGAQRFLIAPSAPKLAQDREAAAPPEPLPTETAAEAQSNEIPSAEELLRTEIEQAPLEPPPAMAKAPPPPTANADRPAPATARPPAQQQKLLSTPPAQQAPKRPATQPALALRPTTQPTDSAPAPRQPSPRVASAATATQPRTPPPGAAPATTTPTRVASAPTATQPRTPPLGTAPPTTTPTRVASAPTTTQPRTAPTTPTTQPRTPPGAAPATTPANSNIRQTAAVAPAPGTTPANADATRELERCLGRLVRMCPSGAGGRPGFAEDGALSTSERALLNQRSLFAWSDALSSNVANCSRHLNAAGQAGQTPYQPLATACRGLPTSGPPR